MMDVRCLRCKGRRHCGRDICAIFTKTQSIFKARKALGTGDAFEGSSPSIFVGRAGYPDINLGILAPPRIDDEAWKLDAPRYWAANDLDIPSIVDNRSSLINSRMKVDIRDTSRLVDAVQEIAMSSRPVDCDFDLAKRPHYSMDFDAHMSPMGATASMKKVDLMSNPKVLKKVDKVVSDTDMKAVEGIDYLFSTGLDENMITRLLSVGTLGIGSNRRLVPTRWSITAVDDRVGKWMHGKVRDYPETGNLAFFGGHLGNYFLILFLPDVWSYELFELFIPKGVQGRSDEVQYSTDHEFMQGRSAYAENCAGGYYAARLGVLEKMVEMGRQGSALVFRFITGEYSVPLGVWVVREAVRKALSTRPIEFSSTDLMVRYAAALSRKKFGYELSILLKASKVYGLTRTQKKLMDFV